MKALYMVPTAAALMAGASFSASKVAVMAMPPLWAAALRFGLAACLLLPCLAAFERGAITHLRRHGLALAGLGAVGVAAFNGLLFVGLRHSTAVNAALVMASSPVLTPCLAALLLKESLGVRRMLCAAVSVAGVAVVLLGGGACWVLASGDVWILMANICWGLYCIYSRKLSRHVSPLVLTCGTTVFGALLLGLLAWGVEGPLTHVRWMPQLLWALGFLAVFGSSLTYLFWQLSLARLGTAKTSLFFNLIPVFGVLVAAGMGTPILAHQLLGGAVVVAVVVASLAGRIKEVSHA